MFFSGVIILQNKIKGDRDFIVQTKLYELLCVNRRADASTERFSPARELAISGQKLWDE
jgi:hypothetical protein